MNNKSNRSLSITDIQQIANNLNIDRIQLINRLKLCSLNSFTVSQLKELIKWFRQNKNSNNLQLKHTGRKSELIQTVKRVIQLFDFSMYNNNNQTQQYTHPTISYQQQQQQQQQQYYQQQQRQQQLYAQTPSNTLFNATNGTGTASNYAWNGSYQNNPQQQQQQIAFQQQQQQQISQQTQYNVTTQHYSQLVQHPNFTNNRSPFFQVEKRCCVMPVFSQKRIQFRISLHSDDVSNLRRNSKGSKATKATKGSVGSVDEGLHLRLFNFVTHQHQEWNTSQCDVSINNRKIIIDKRSTRSGVKKKGYPIVSPLDITKEACITMDFEITSNGPFGGVAVIEIVRIFSVESIASRITLRCRPIDFKKDKKCAICNKKNDLLRCSRCKCVWYCGTKHQAKDWPAHQTLCSPNESKGKLKSISFKQSDDDDVVCGQTKVSLRCPLSICRINEPIRGTECTHPQCIDLKTFLSFSHKTGTWQCPVCLKPLKFDEIVIDNEMKEILSQTDEDIDLVRLYPNGSFKAITLQEQLQEERMQNTKRKRKRKKDDMEDNIDTNRVNTSQRQRVLPPNLRKSANNNNNNNNDTNTDTDTNTNNTDNGNNSAPEDDNGQNLINPIVLD